MPTRSTCKKGPSLKSVIHVGADVGELKAALPEVTKSVMAVIGSAAGDDVKKAALAALEKTFAVQNVTLTDTRIDVRSAED